VLTATAISRGRIDLAWQDNSGNETGFQIERSRSGGAFSLIATAGAGATTWSDTSGLTPNKTYSYRVRAVNAAGNSGYSNTASATTPKK
jgi:predicted phage tail protein